jgi:hypothetical protein
MKCRNLHGKNLHLNKAGIFPDKDLVLTVAVGGDQLTSVFRPGQIAYLNIII